MDPLAHRKAAERAGHIRQILQSCGLCPRACRVNRLAGQVGYCGLDARVRCFREMLFDDEESMLNPSHQIYLAGCNLRCCFCTVEEWNGEPEAAPVMDIQAMVATVDLRRRQGARTLNILGGEPAISVHGVLHLLAAIDPQTTVVWNSNMYYNVQVARALEGLVDIYLADLKCGNDRCAMSLLDAPDYLAVVKQNILLARTAGTVIVRHLVLPGHMDCCVRPILAWLVDQAPDVMVSLRGTYVPPAGCTAAPEGYLEPQELALARTTAGDLGLRLIQ